MKNQRVCPTCHTKKFRKSGDTGLVCKYGHKLLGVQSEEAEDAFGQGRGTRRKTVFKIKEETFESSPAQQRSDFLLIIQFALQIISRCMIQDLNFPPELEPTVRELWILYIADSKKEMADAYMFEALDKETKDKIKNIKNDIGTLEEEEILLERMRDDNDDRSDSEDEKSTLQKSGSRIKWQDLKFHHSLAFIYHACLYLNYPILPNDLVRWCRAGDIPYLKIQERIPPRLLGSLSLKLTHSMNHIPSPGEIRKAAFRLNQCFAYNCKLNLPDLNVFLYLDRFCAQFFLPVEGYYYARYILELYRESHILYFQDPKSPKQIPVIAFLMGCVLVTVKLMYSIGDNTPKTLASVCEFDRTTTKEAYMKKIRQNIEQWKIVYEQQNDLGNIIQNLKDTSIASKIALHLRQRNLVMLNALESVHRGSPVNAKRSTFSNLFMDTTVWDKTNHNTILTNADEIELGEHFFARRTAIAPKDYLDILELATLVTGELSNSTIEIALHNVEQCIIRKCDFKSTKKVILNKIFKPTIP